MDNVVKILGRVLDIPDDPETLRKWDIGVLQEGKSKTPYVWLDEWVQDFRSCVYERHSHMLTKTSRGSVFLDDEKVKDEKEREEGLRVFETLYKLKK